MGLTKYRLGSLIELSKDRNSELQYGIDDVKGISIQKTFIKTKADMSGVSLRPYYLVRPDDFAYVPVTSRNGDKITLAHNDTQNTYLVSSSYVVFRVKEPEILDSDYLFIYFNRSEFDRYARFKSCGSAREVFSWNEMCKIEIDLPPLDIQQKYVNVYKALLANQRCYERGLDDLKLTCDLYIEKLRKELPCEELGPYISEKSVRNSDLSINNIRGINCKSQFCETRAKTKWLDFRKYKIVRTGQFAYSPSGISMGSIALLNDKDCIVSPLYTVFEVTDENKILPQYLMIWFGRKEFQRMALFYATGSVRDTFSYKAMQKVKIPIPDISIQQKIADIYDAYITRIDINEKLKLQIRDICPILFKGSIDEAAA